MTHLNIQQGQNVEVVSTNLIKKLYDAAISVPEPLEGEQDAAYLSGNLQVDKSYRAQVEYLTNRFDDLHINVTDSYYIPFEDSAVLNVLLANNIGSDGIGVTEAEAANATFTGWNTGGTFYNNRDITSFNEFSYFTKANTNPPACLFKQCTNLSEIDLSQVTKITDQEFSYVSLQDVNMPNLQITDGSNQFRGSGVVTVTSLGNTITKIPNSCFYDCEFLTTVTLPQTVTEIGGSAFSTYNKYWTKKLTTVNGLDHVTIFGEGCFWGQVALSANFSQLKNATSIVGDAFYNCRNLTGEVDLPNIVSLSNNVFWNTKPTKIKCLGKVAAIPNSAFATSNNASNEIKQSLTEVYLPYECTSIGYFSFGNRTRLATVKQYTQSIDNWVEGEAPAYGDITRITNIGEEAFRYTAISGALNLPNLATIGQYAFAETSVSSITDLGSITSIPDMCFNNCYSLTTVTLPNSCTSIGGGAFAYCDALQSIDLGGVTTIAQQAFIADPVLTTVTGTSNLTSIGSNAFQNCNLSGALDLSNVVTINSNAFSGCTALTSVTLSKLENIDGENAFGFSGITQITLPNTLRKFDCRTFRNCAIQKLVIPEGCLTITGGQDLSKNGTMRYLEIPSTVTNMDIFFHRAYETNAESSIYLVIKATTPPNLKFYGRETVDSNSYITRNFAGIYVPDSALSTYQDVANLTDDQKGWKVAAVQAKLKSISQLQTDSPTWWAEYQTRVNP